MQEMGGDESMVKKWKEHFSLGEAVFSCVKWFILIFALIVVLVPLLHVIASSFSSADGLISGVYLWPKDLSFDGYKAALANSWLLISYKNSFVYMFVGALVSTFLTIFAAYPLSRRELPGRNLIMFLFTFTMLFNGGLIPTYIVVSKLGLVDTMWGFVLVDAMNVWIVIVVRTFLQFNIPNELYDAASIDGCTDLNVLWKVVLPLSKPIIAVSLLMYAVSYWNGYFNGVVYLRREELQPLQVFLRNLLLANTSVASQDMASLPAEDMMRLRELQYVLKYSTVVLATVPMLCIYPFVQKHFVKGVMVGSIKG